MSNPLDDYLEEKTAAGFGSFLKSVGAGAAESISGKGLGRLGVQAAMVGGGVAAARAGEKAYYAATKKRDFNQMMGANPQLKEHFDENPGRFLQHYNSFRKMNPRYASEPTVSGSYMHQMGLNPAGAGAIIVESIGRTPPSTMRDTLQTGMRMTEGAMVDPKLEQSQQQFEQRERTQQQQFGQREQSQQKMHKQKMRQSRAEFEERKRQFDER